MMTYEPENISLSMQLCIENAKFIQTTNDEQFDESLKKLSDTNEIFYKVILQI